MFSRQTPFADLNQDPAAPAERRSQVLAMALAVVCTVLMVWLNEATHERTARALTEMEAAHQFSDAVRTLVHSVDEMNNSARGYVASGDDSAHLPSYRAAVLRVNQTIRNLPAAPSELLSSAQWMQFHSLLQQEMADISTRLHVHQLGVPDTGHFVWANRSWGGASMPTLAQQAEALVLQADQLIAQHRLRVVDLLEWRRYGIAGMLVLMLGGFFLYARQAQALRRSEARQHQLLQVERDALHAQVSERTRRLTDLTSYLQRVVEGERAHLARELHDELGGLLMAAKLNVARIKSRLPPDESELRSRLGSLTSTLDQGMALKRRIIDDLRPASLSTRGLVATLEALLRDFAEKSGLDVRSTLEPVELDVDGELTVFRMVQEALTNVARYAQANRVEVQLRATASGARISIQDNGVGFDLGTLPPTTHGLSGMRHRIEASGGQLKIRTHPGRGTHLVATLPPRSAPDSGFHHTDFGPGGPLPLN